MSVIDLFQVSFKAEHPIAQFSAVALGTAQDYGVTQVPLNVASLTTNGAFGIAQRAVASGQNASVMLHGISRAVVGAATTRGQRVTGTASGFVTPVTSGAAALTHVLGVALTTAASGMIAHVFLRAAFNGQSGAAL